MVDGFGIQAQPQAAFTALCFDYFQERLSDNSFAVVTNNDGGAAGNHLLQTACQPAADGPIDTIACFAVNPDHLLSVGHNTSLHAGGPGPGSHQASAADMVLGE